MTSRRSALARGVAAAASAALALTALAVAVPSASGAPSLQARAYTYGNWAQPGAGFMATADDTLSQVYQLTSRSQFPDLAGTPGPIYAAGTFVKSGSTTINRVGQWNGTAWVPLTGDDTGIGFGVGQQLRVVGGNSAGYAFPGVFGAVLGGDDSLYVGGYFTASDDTLNNVGKWNGSDWVRMGDGLRSGSTGDDVVQDMVMGNDFIGMDDTNYADDTVYAVGGFVGTCATLACTSTGRTAVGVAQYSQADDTWYPVGSGALDANKQVFAGAYIDDTLYVGGNFQTIGGTSASLIAQYSTAAGGWSPLASGLGSAATSVYAMAVHPITKDLYVGGTFGQPVGGTSGSTPGIIKWDYADDTWYAVGTGLTSGNIDDIGFSADGKTMWLGGWNGLAGGTLANHVLTLASEDLDDTAATTISGAWGYVKSSGAIGVTGPTVSGINQSAVRAVLPQGNTSVMFGGNFATAGAINAGRVATFTPGAEPDPNVPATPPGPPLNVVAKGGWQKVTVNWDLPLYEGTYPVTNYLVQATAVGAAPAGNVCITRLTDAKLTECTFTRLTPGVRYTFTVQGLNGGGWGERSAPSNVATPSDLRITSHGRKKLTVLGINIGSEVSARGSAPGYPAGTRIAVFIKEGDTGQWVEQKNSGLMSDAAGNFSWKRKFAKGKNATPISVQFGIGPDRSNIVRIPPVK